MYMQLNKNTCVLKYAYNQTIRIYIVYRPFAVSVGTRRAPEKVKKRGSISKKTVVI
jgi:hypothetical protein